MKSKGFFVANLIKTLLISFIAISLSASLFFEYHKYESHQSDLLKKFTLKQLAALGTDGDIALSEQDLNRFLSYFQSMIHREDTRIDAYAMMGFCYYHLGQKDKALAAYQEAVNLRPDFLWFQYDLGVIYLEQNQYQQAEQAFQKAFLTRQQYNLDFLKNSKIFASIHLSADIRGPSFVKRLRDGYGLSFYFASICEEKMGNTRDSLLSRQQALRLGIADQGQDILKPQLRVF